MPRIVVIGAGPAGTVAAILLARAGIETLLIEQHRFPRDKVCGECLSAMGIEVLRRLELHERVQSLQPTIFRRATIHACDGEQAEFALPNPMWGLSRLKFDALLLNAALDAGVQLIQPARCESIIPDVRLRMLESNEVKTIDADFVIVADGKGSLLSDGSTSASNDLGLKAHFRNIDAPSDAIELFAVNGHYGGIAPIEDRLWNIAFSVPASRFKEHAGNLDALFSEIVAENRALAGRMRGAERVSDWMTSPLPRFPVSRSWPNGVVPIGNSAAALEPIGGEGMGLAMRSAELAAGAVIHAIQSGTDLNAGKLRADYQKLWNMRRLACRAAARIVSSPALARLAVCFAQIDGPGQLALQLVGK